MTQTELEQLSRDVAKKRGISAPEGYIKGKSKIGMSERWDKTEHGRDLVLGWLHEDSAFCFELMVSEKLDVTIFDEVVRVIYYDNVAWLKTKPKTEAFNAHTDANQATRVAILRAYLAKMG